MSSILDAVTKDSARSGGVPGAATPPSSGGGGGGGRYRAAALVIVFGVAAGALAARMFGSADVPVDDLLTEKVERRTAARAEATPRAGEETAAGSDAVADVPAAPPKGSRRDEAAHQRALAKRKEAAARAAAAAPATPPVVSVKETGTVVATPPAAAPAGATERPPAPVAATVEPAPAPVVVQAPAPAVARTEPAAVVVTETAEGVAKPPAVVVTETETEIAQPAGAQPAPPAAVVAAAPPSASAKVTVPPPDGFANVPPAPVKPPGLPTSPSAMGAASVAEAPAVVVATPPAAPAIVAGTPIPSPAATAEPPVPGAPAAVVEREEVVAEVHASPPATLEEAGEDAEAPVAAEAAPADPLEVSAERPSGAPEVSVLFVAWSREPSERVVSMRVAEGTLNVVHEGEYVEGLQVSAIHPESVDLSWTGQKFRVAVNPF